MGHCQAYRLREQVHRTYPAACTADKRLRAARRQAMRCAQPEDRPRRACPSRRMGAALSWGGPALQAAGAWGGAHGALPSRWAAPHPKQ